MEIFLSVLLFMLFWLIFFMNCVAVNEMNFLLLVFAFLMSLIGLAAIWCSFRIFSYYSELKTIGFNNELEGEK